MVFKDSFLQMRFPSVKQEWVFELRLDQLVRKYFKMRPQGVLNDVNSTGPKFKQLKNVRSCYHNPDEELVSISSEEIKF